MVSFHVNPKLPFQIISHAIANLVKHQTRHWVVGVLTEGLRGKNAAVRFARASDEAKRFPNCWRKRGGTGECPMKGSRRSVPKNWISVKQSEMTSLLENHRILHGKGSLVHG